MCGDHADLYPPGVHQVLYVSCPPGLLDTQEQCCGCRLEGCHSFHKLLILQVKVVLVELDLTYGLRRVAFLTSACLLCGGKKNEPVWAFARFPGGGGVEKW